MSVPGLSKFLASNWKVVVISWNIVWPNHGQNFPRDQNNFLLDPRNFYKTLRTLLSLSGFKCVPSVSNYHPGTEPENRTSPKTFRGKSKEWSFRVVSSEFSRVYQLVIRTTRIYLLVRFKWPLTCIKRWFNQNNTSRNHLYSGRHLSF